MISNYIGLALAIILVGAWLVILLTIFLA